MTGGNNEPRNKKRKEKGEISLIPSIQKMICIFLPLMRRPLCPLIYATNDAGETWNPIPKFVAYVVRYKDWLKIKWPLADVWQRPADCCLQMRQKT